MKQLVKKAFIGKRKWVTMLGGLTVFINPLFIFGVVVWGFVLYGFNVIDEKPVKEVVKTRHKKLNKVANVLIFMGYILLVIIIATIFLPSGDYPIPKG